MHTTEYYIIFCILGNLVYGNILLYLSVTYENAAYYFPSKNIESEIFLRIQRNLHIEFIAPLKYIYFSIFLILIYFRMSMIYE